MKQTLCDLLYHLNPKNDMKHISVLNDPTNLDCEKYLLEVAAGGLKSCLRGGAAGVLASYASVPFVEDPRIAIGFALAPFAGLILDSAQYLLRVTYHTLSVTGAFTEAKRAFKDVLGSYYRSD